MSNYTKTTNFATKDNLSPGNPLKIVKGTEIDTEYNNIATAVATKTDNASAAITGGTITGITDLAVADGGTGASTAANARSNLSAAASGANSDITSLTGLTTPLSVAQGGTAASTAANARTSLGLVIGTDVLAPNGSAASLTSFPTLNQNTTGNAATVTTNANLTGDVTSVGNATTLTNAPVIAKVLTGYVSGAGTVADTDSILQAIQKLNGNDATNANLTGMVTSVGNATTVVTNANLTGGVTSVGNAATVVTNANLTGAVTSVGNATSLGSFTSANLLGALTDETGTGVAVFATNPVLVTPNLGTPSAAVLTSATGLPLSSGVTGTLPVVNGGTGTATPSIVAGTNITVTGSWPNQTVAASGSSGTVTSVALSGGTTGLTVSGSPITTSGTITVAGTLAVANGGTGLSTLTANNVIIGNGTSAPLFVAPSTSGNVLTSNGTTWQSTAPAGGSPTAVTHTFSGPVDPISSIILSASIPVQIGATVEAVTGAFATTINFADKNATAISFTNLQGVSGSINPSLMASLTTFSFPELTAVGISFFPSQMAALTTLSAPKLKSVGGTFNPNSLASLTTLSFPELVSVGSSFGPSTMAALTTLSCPALKGVGGDFNASSMAALTTFSFLALERIGGAFNPSNMAALTTLSCPALVNTGSNLSANGMASLTTFSFPAITSIGGAFNPSSMAALTTISLPVLTSINNVFVPTTMAALTSISIPAIITLGATMTSGNAINLPSGTAAVTTFELPITLLRVGNGGGNVNITSAALLVASVDNILVRLAALDGTGGTTTFDNRTVTITGTSATPSATGLAAKATLVARGCTVTNN